MVSTAPRRDLREFEQSGWESGCFVAGTPVHTKEGLVPIEKLRVGDWVLSQPEMKGELTYRQVVTGNHLFWVKDVGWTYNDNTFLGPTIDLRNGRVQVCKFSAEDNCDQSALEAHERLARRVFNIEVDGLRTYYIGEPGIWVHDPRFEG